MMGDSTENPSIYHQKVPANSKHSVKIHMAGIFVEFLCTSSKNLCQYSFALFLHQIDLQQDVILVRL